MNIGRAEISKLAANSKGMLRTVASAGFSPRITTRPTSAGPPRARPMGMRDTISTMLPPRHRNPISRLVMREGLLASGSRGRLFGGGLDQLLQREHDGV